jgi:hypothetical protein
VRVIAEEIADQEAHTSHVLSYQLVGTPGYKSNMLANIEKPIQFQQSHLSPSLQVADLMAYLYRRFDGHRDRSPGSKVSRRDVADNSTAAGRSPGVDSLSTKTPRGGVLGGQRSGNRPVVTNNLAAADQKTWTILTSVGDETRSQVAAVFQH